MNMTESDYNAIVLEFSEMYPNFIRIANEQRAPILFTCNSRLFVMESYILINDNIPLFSFVDVTKEDDLVIKIAIFEFIVRASKFEIVIITNSIADRDNTIKKLNRMASSLILSGFEIFDNTSTCTEPRYIQGVNLFRENYPDLFIKLGKQYKQEPVSTYSIFFAEKTLKEIEDFHRI